MNNLILNTKAINYNNWFSDLKNQVKDFLSATEINPESTVDVISSLLPSNDSISISEEAKNALVQVVAEAKAELSAESEAVKNGFQLSAEQLEQYGTKINNAELLARLKALQPDPDWTVVAKPIEATTQSGHKVTVYSEQYEEEGASKTQLMARVDKTDGESLTYKITDNTVISEDENNNIIVFSDNTRSLKGTAGNDVIISFSADNIEGGDGDDTIIILDKGSMGSTLYVNAGAGNDTLIAGNLRHAEINMGDGDDLIQANIVDGSRINMGAGNDTLNGDEVYGNINMGDGNNALRAKMSGGNISAGDGNNVFDAGDFTVGTMSFGAGNNKIVAQSLGGIHGRWTAVKAATVFVPAVTIDGGTGSMDVSVNGNADDTKFNGRVTLFVEGELNNSSLSLTTVRFYQSAASNAPFEATGLAHEKRNDLLSLYEEQGVGKSEKPTTLTGVV